MFEYIKGNVTQLTPTSVVLDTNGIGWLLNIPTTTSSQLIVGKDVLLYVHQHYTQDKPPVLYGFLTSEEREFFRMLMSVEGVGANTARIMLSAYSVGQLGNFICNGNIGRIVKIKGIGQRTAERIIFTLKDKASQFSTDTDTDTNTDNESSLTSSKSKCSSSSSLSANESDAVLALISLGYAQTPAEKVVRKVCKGNPALRVDDIVRMSLSEI